jgi:very-short-patch-repair endonuclease/predicted transcriptional regulator of viral defense system
MGAQSLHSRAGRAVWTLVREQHDLVTRQQLLELGYSSRAIKHRVAKGRLHPVGRGVYAVGTPNLTRHGRWMAAVLMCGPEAALSDESAAALLEIRADRGGEIEVSVPSHVSRRPRGVLVHRRKRRGPWEVTRHNGIPVTSPACTLVDLATRLGRKQLEAAVNQADKRDLIDPESLRSALEKLARRPGVAVLRELLDRRTFRLTDSELERYFLPIVRRVGLPPPETGERVDGFDVDFYWPDFDLVVETDGLRYHRTPSQQARDRLRDQAHLGAGTTPLRFTHEQVRFEPEHVERTLMSVVRRLRGYAGASTSSTS